MTDIAQHMVGIRTAARRVAATDRMIDAAQTLDAAVALGGIWEDQVGELTGLILGEAGAPVLDQVITVFGDAKIRMLAQFTEPEEVRGRILWQRIAGLIRAARIERAISRNLDNAPLLRDEATIRLVNLTDELLALLDQTESLQLLHRIGKALGAEAPL